MIVIPGHVVAEYDDRNPRRKFRRMIRDNLHMSWIIPFSLVENLPTLFAGLFNVMIDAIRLGHQYLIAVRHSVANMNEFHEIYRENSNDDEDTDIETETESVISDADSQVSRGSRVSTRSMSKSKKQL